MAKARLFTEAEIAEKGRLARKAWSGHTKVPPKPAACGKSRPSTSKPSEYQSQAAVIRWWDGFGCRRWSIPWFLLFSIPNGAVLAGNAQRRAIQMARLKATGLRPGVPDLFLAVGKPSISAYGLYLEMKSAGGKLSDNQRAVITALRYGGYHCCVCFSADEAIRAITGYLNTP